MTKRNIGIVGFGNMGAALGQALKVSNAGKIMVYDKDRLKRLSAKGFVVCDAAGFLLCRADIVIIAVKPQDVRGLLSAHRLDFIQRRPLVISIAAGLSTGYFEKILPGIRVVRAMPTLAAKVSRSITFLAGGKFAGKSDIAAARKILSSVGKTIFIQEKFLDKVTGITGSGVGYVYYLMNCLFTAALAQGFSREVSREMVLRTFGGAVSLAENADLDFKDLVKQVASAKGTTQAALDVFDKSRLEKIMHQGIAAAVKRAGEISRTASC